MLYIIQPVLFQHEAFFAGMAIGGHQVGIHIQIDACECELFMLEAGSNQPAKKRRAE